MNELKIFNHGSFGELGVLQIEGKEFFPAVDVAKMLGYSNPHDALNKHCNKDGVAFCEVIDSLGRTQQKKFINEPNLYRLIIKSKLPQAEQFEKWVFEEVLPDIRKHGMYMNDNLLEKTLADPNFMIGLLTNYNEEKKKRAALEAQNKQLSEKIIEDKPKVDMYNGWLDIDGFIKIGDFGKRTGIGAKIIFVKLREMGILMSNKSDWNMPYARYMKYFVVRDKVVNGRNCRVTLLNKDGIVWLHKKLIKEKELLETLEVDYVADQKIGLN